MQRAIFILLALSWALLAAGGCAEHLTVAPHPFVLSEVPDDFPKLPLRVAVVRTDAMKKFPNPLDPDLKLGEKMATAAFNGIVEAARLVATEVVAFDGQPVGQFDLVCLPTNPYMDVRTNRSGRPTVYLTMEVLLRTADNRERGLLLEADGHPGRRRAVPIRLEPSDGGPSREAGVMGAIIYGSHFEEAVNNALFYLALDFAEKLRKRGEQILREKPAGE